MTTNKFAHGNQINRNQQDELLTALSRLSDETQLIEIIKSRFDVDGVCPFCGHDRYYRHGFANELQRYRCRECKKTFNALTGTPFTRLRHKEKWLDYFKTLADSSSIRQAATVVGVSNSTSFRWHHLFLTWIIDHPTVFQGIMEADETVDSL